MDIVNRLKEFARRIKLDAMTVYFAARDPRTPFLVRVLAFTISNDRGQTPWMIAGQGEYREGSLMTLPQVAAHLEQLGADTTLGEDLGRYYARGADDGR